MADSELLQLLGKLAEESLTGPGLDLISGSRDLKKAAGNLPFNEEVQISEVGDRVEAMTVSSEGRPPASVSSPDSLSRILVDADACPVKEEVYRVAARHGLEVILVANSRMRTPLDDTIRLVVVEGDLDAADDWIAEHSRERDVVVTGDIPLAARCLEKRAAAISPTGRIFTEDMIGDALATREMLSQMREVGLASGGPAPFTKQDRSRFLQALEEAIRAQMRGRPSGVRRSSS